MFRLGHRPRLFYSSVVLAFTACNGTNSGTGTAPVSSMSPNSSLPSPNTADTVALTPSEGPRSPTATGTDDAQEANGTPPGSPASSDDLTPPPDESVSDTDAAATPDATTDAPVPVNSSDTAEPVTPDPPSEDPLEPADGGAADPPDEPLVVDPSAPLTPIAFFPSKNRTDTCTDASVSIQFNRTPRIQVGGQLRIHEASGATFDSVTANPRDDLYFSDFAKRSSGGQTFDTDALDVVFNTVVFQPKGKLTPGMTYYVTVDEGMITDSEGNPFSVAETDDWRFTVREREPPSASSYTLAADGSGDFCSVEGVLQALPDAAQAPRLITVARGIYPGIVRMADSNVHFVGAGIDESVFSLKNAATMNSSREGIILTGSDVTFENLTIFNTYLDDSNGQQAEALYVDESSHRVFLDNVHLRSHQDTLRVDGDTVFMKGGKISGSTDPLWGYGGFYCDGCELASRTSGHAFVVARSTKGFAMVNCRVTKGAEGVNNTDLAQYHDGSEPGRIAFVNCRIDDHIVGWRRPENNAWYEYGNTDLQTSAPVKFGGVQLTAGSPLLDELSSAQNWLGWSPE